MPSSSLSTLFLDIGGVLLTNGWDRHSRASAADQFHLDYADMNRRHRLAVGAYEEGRLSLDEYLNRVVFHRRRNFSRDEFKTFMYSQSRPFPEMIELVRDLKRRYGFKIAAVSNEGRELTEYRVQQFKLETVIDFFISSCFVHHRKPDLRIYRIALDIAQASPQQVVYVDDRSKFAETAQGMGIRSIVHCDHETTKRSLETLGFC